MLSLFRRPKAQLVIQVEDSPHYLGSTLNVCVTLTSEQGFSVRRGTIELLCRETYYVPYTGSPGSSAHTKENENVITLKGQFLIKEETEVGARDYHVRFPIPESAPPTVDGKLLNITWLVRASLDVKRARDLHQEQVVSVLTAPVYQDNNEIKEVSDSLFAQGTFAGCELFLSVSPSHASAGENIQVNIGVLALEALRNPKVRVELERWEAAGSKYADVTEDRSVVAEAISLSANERREWSLGLKVPSLLAPSKEGNRTRVVWKVKGILDLGRKGQSVVQQEIAVSSVKPQT